MSEESPSIDQNPGRWLVLAFGGLFSEAGVQAMLTSRTTQLYVDIPIACVGVGLLLLGVFWKRIRFDRTEFAKKLNSIASHPGLWVAIAFGVWLAMMAVNTAKEVLENNEIVALRNDVQSVANVINRSIMPRHLTKSQQSAISNLLLQFEPHQFAFQLPKRDEEAGEYRVDIQQALEKGGWTLATQNPYEYTDDVPEGLSINFIQTQEHLQEPNDPRNPKADRLLMMALGLAGVRLNQLGGGGGVNITEDRLVIGIGHRRTDSYELTPPDNF